MYTSLNRDPEEILPGIESSTKYTEYLKTLSHGTIPRDKNERGLQRNPSQKRNRPSNPYGSTPFLPVSDNEVKFANIFSPNESNALKLHLLQKASSLPLIDPLKNNTHDNSSSGGAVGTDSSLIVDDDHTSYLNRRRSTALGILHENETGSRRKGDPVANILYSTIRHGVGVNNSNEYDNPSADETLHTGSDSKVDYDPHEPLPAVDQIALRHELLNNIRAISRATYFEDLYTGKVPTHTGSPEQEIIKLLENRNRSNPPRSNLGATKQNSERVIPSKDASLSRVDRWVKETSEVRTPQNQQDTDDDKGQDAWNERYNQMVWNDDHVRGKKKSKTKRTTRTGAPPEVTTESDVDTSPQKRGATTKKNSVTDTTPSSTRHFSRNTDRSIVSRSMGKPLVSPGISGSYLQAKYLNDSNPSIYRVKNDYLTVDSSSQHGSRRPFSFGMSSSADVPLSVSLPNVAHNSSNSYASMVLPNRANQRSTYVASQLDNLTHSMANLSTGTSSFNASKQKQSFDKRKTVGGSNEQVGRKPTQPLKAKGIGKQNRHVDRAVPGIYTRLNQNQWVVKKVFFYVNGDDLYPRFEYRFRPGKDIRDLDQLLDLLTKRFPTLPTGARYIFTMDGYPISGLDELVHENSYLVSSIRKFKAVKYQKPLNDEGPAKHPPLTRKLSASDGHLEKIGVGRTKYRQTQKLDTKYHSVNSLHSKSVSDVPKLVAHVIEEAAVSGGRSGETSMMYREPIRIVNGENPSLQSQILLNTKTSQPFEDLVRDLASSVQMRGQPAGDCMKTLTGRHIKSYSQLRSELKAGQRAFFIYCESSKVGNHRGTNKPLNVSRNPNNRSIANGTLGGNSKASRSTDPSSDESRLGTKRRPQQSLRSQ